MSDEKRVKLDDNHSFTTWCGFRVPYERWPNHKFIPYNPEDPRGLPFPPGKLPYSKHCVVSEDRNSITITLQHGAYLKEGENGTYEDAVIALARDLLLFKNQSSSPLACREFSTAITKLEEALGWLDQRAAALQAAGTHGTPK